MGLFSALFASGSKSIKLAKLQRQIVESRRSPEAMLESLMAEAVHGKGARGTVISEYLDLCENDAGVARVMREYGLSRNDLEEIYHTLVRAGLGQWCSGHYAALSTIAYVEPLQYYAECSKRGDNMLGVAANLLAYWDNKIPQGGLAALLR